MQLQNLAALTSIYIFKKFLTGLSQEGRSEQGLRTLIHMYNLCQPHEPLLLKIANVSVVCPMFGGCFSKPPSLRHWSTFSYGITNL